MNYDAESFVAHRNLGMASEISISEVVDLNKVALKISNGES